MEEKIKVVSEYKIGDKVVYPMHGAGEIVAVEEKVILGEYRKYFVLRLPVNDMKIMIPMDNMREIGIRDLIGKEKAGELKEMINNFPVEINANWNKRYRENMIKIKSGDIFEVAQVVKTLMKIEGGKGLSTGEKKMLTNAKQILISELIFVFDMEKEQIEEYLRTNCV